MTDLLTIREAAERCEISYEALRRRVDRGTLRSVRSPRDGRRRVLRTELQQAGLWPGSTPTQAAGQAVELRAELERARHELAALGARAGAEQQARERAELAHHQARAAQQTAEAQRADLADELDELAAAGPIRAWRLRRQRRQATHTAAA